MMYLLQAGSPTGGWLLPVMLLAMMLFMIYQSFGRQRKEKKFLNSIKKGDKVVMRSGLHGKISEITDTTVVIETMSGKLMFERSAISMEYSQRLQK